MKTPRIFTGSACCVSFIEMLVFLWLITYLFGRPRPNKKKRLQRAIIKIYKYVKKTIHKHRPRTSLRSMFFLPSLVNSDMIINYK